MLISTAITGNHANLLLAQILNYVSACLKAAGDLKAEMNLRTPKTLRVGESPLRSTESAEAAYRSFMLSRSSSSKLSGGLGGAAGYGAGAVSEARINPAASNPFSASASRFPNRSGVSGSSRAAAT